MARVLQAIMGQPVTLALDSESQVSELIPVGVIAIMSLEETIA